MRALQMPEGTEFVGLQLRRLPASVTAASNSASNLLARARPLTTLRTSRRILPGGSGP